MMRHSCWARFAVLSLAWLVFVGHVRAQVKDDAGFFSPAAISQANEIARDIKLSYQKDFKVETIRALPPEKLATFKTLSQAEKKKLFEGWADSRAKALDVQGIYVQVRKQPARRPVAGSCSSTTRSIAPSPVLPQSLRALTSWRSSNGACRLRSPLGG